MFKRMFFLLLALTSQAFAANSYFDAGIPTFYYNHSTSELFTPPLKLPTHPATRDDSGTYSPINFLYTDASGKVLSAPTSMIGGGGAPTTADYLVKTADAGLSAERVVTDTTSITWNWGTGGQAKAERAALTGDVTASANGNATTIANDAVTYPKMQNVSAASRLLGRGSAAGSGDVEEISLSGLTMSGTTLTAAAFGESIGWFGSGADGDVTINSTVTMARDMYYNNLTFAAGGSLRGGYRIHVAGIADFTSADAGAITATPVNGDDATASGGKPAQSALWASKTLGAGNTGATAGSGTTGAGGQAAAPSDPAVMAGGNGGAGGAGGSGSGGAGGASRAGTSGTTVFNGHLTDVFHRISAGGVTMITGGAPGTGGSGGGGNGATAGGGGGGAAAGGGTIALYARTIKTGVSTLAATIQAKGGNGGKGRNQGVADVGGGGGAGGAGGGWIQIAYLTKDGSSVTNFVDASGGTGGDGGNGTGTGIGGDGGAGGQAGRIQVFNLGTGTMTSTALTAGSSGNPGSGTTGGTGGAGGSAKVSL